MAHPERFELPTKWFEATYSIQLSYGCVEGANSNRFEGGWERGFRPQLESFSRHGPCDGIWRLKIPLPWLPRRYLPPFAPPKSTFETPAPDRPQTEQKLN